MSVQTITVHNESQARLLDNLRLVSAHANDTAHALAEQTQPGIDPADQGLATRIRRLLDERDTHKRRAVDMGIDPADVTAIANGAWNANGEWVHIEIVD